MDTAPSQFLMVADQLSGPGVAPTACDLKALTSTGTLIFNVSLEFERSAVKASGQSGQSGLSGRNGRKRDGTHSVLWPSEVIARTKTGRAADPGYFHPTAAKTGRAGDPGYSRCSPFTNGLSMRERDE